MGRISTRSQAIGLGATLALALGGCGGSSHSSTSASQNKPKDAVLEQGLLKSGELAGMISVLSSPIHNAAAWVAPENLAGSAQTAAIDWLRRIGFVAGDSEQLSSNSNPNRFGLTLDEQFTSAKGATAELAHETASNGPWTTFSVTGIRSAVGFEQNGRSGGRNIAFTHGDFLYLVGSGWQDGTSNALPRATMIAVAQRLYHRVSG